MKETTDIQKLINKRAEKKLSEKIQGLHNLLCKGETYDLLTGIKINIGTVDNPKTVSVSWIFSEENLGKVIFNTNIDKYIKDETKAFVEKVDSLRDDVDNLLNQDYQDY